MGWCCCTLTNAQWLINGLTVNEGDRLFLDGTPDWAIVIGGGGGIVGVTGTAPIQIWWHCQNLMFLFTAAATINAGSMSLLTKQSRPIDAGAELNVDPTQAYTAAATQGTLTLQPGGDATVLPVATTTNAGLMSAADKNAFDSLVTNGWWCCKHHCW